ncbi:MAG: transglycosylase SLT domain-containing protein [Chitinophagales bacterium]
MRKKLIRLVPVFVLALISWNTSSANFYFKDSTSSDIDPVIVQLDSMSYSLFTRDKFFASGDELLASINMPTELIPRFTEAEIKEKMNLIPSEVPMTYNAYVKQFIDMFAYKKRGLMTRCLANSQIYFPIFEEILDRKGIPLEFKYLPVVESAFNPVAVSHCGATGLWQLMYGTGSMLGLDINSYIDERRDPVKATEAAADYLKKMYDMYGDWNLVLAAYNSGPGNVNKAIARAGGTKNFWAIMNYLPAETRSYVPCYLAAVYVMEYAEDFKLMSAEPKRDLYAVDTVYITSKVSLKHISDVLGIGEDELQFLNPSIKKGIIPYTANGFAINLPVSYFALFEAKKEDIMNDTSMVVQNTETIIASAPKVVYHKVLKNQTLSAIAGKYGVTTSSIKKWNKLKNSYVYPGQKLKIYTTTATVSTTSAKYDQVFSTNKVIDNSKAQGADTVVKTTPSVTALAAATTVNKSDSMKNVAASNGDKLNSQCNCIYHVVQPGDTLWNLTQRYQGLTIDKLKADNKELQSRPIKVGDIIKILL